MGPQRHYFLFTKRLGQLAIGCEEYDRDRHAQFM